MKIKPRMRKVHGFYTIMDALWNVLELGVREVYFASDTCINLFVG